MERIGESNLTNKRNLSLEQFKFQAMKKHDCLYDYSLVEYNGYRSKINIICKDHGIFNQLASNHLQGNKCPKCSKNSSIKKQSKTTEQFILKAKKIHDNYYDYSLTNYINKRTKILISCPKHGNFNQSPNNHLCGSGCYECGKEKIGINQKLTKEEFVLRSGEIHKNLYGYNFVDYKNGHTKVKIICSEHGVFKQNPSNHLNGQGCPLCAHFVSILETRWLDSLEINNCHRQKMLLINYKKYSVDAYIPEINTIYEFFGDYWHGNPKIYNPNKINSKTNCSFGELYEKTLNRIKLFEENGYKIEYIWENDWKIKNDKH